MSDTEIRWELPKSVECWPERFVSRPDPGLRFNSRDYDLVSSEIQNTICFRLPGVDSDGNVISNASFRLDKVNPGRYVAQESFARYYVGDRQDITDAASALTRLAYDILVNRDGPGKPSDGNLEGKRAIMIFASPMLFGSLYTAWSKIKDAASSNGVDICDLQFAQDQSWNPDLMAAGVYLADMMGPIPDAPFADHLYLFPNLAKVKNCKEKVYMEEVLKRFEIASLEPCDYVRENHSSIREWLSDEQCYQSFNGWWALHFDSERVRFHQSRVWPRCMPLSRALGGLDRPLNKVVYVDPFFFKSCVRRAVPLYHSSYGIPSFIAPDTKLKLPSQLPPHSGMEWVSQTLFQKAFCSGNNVGHAQKPGDDVFSILNKVERFTEVM